MIIDLTCIRTWAKYLMILSSGCLIALGVGRFFTSLTDPMQYILNIYFILLGAILISLELGWERVLINFEFYRFFFGKAIFSVFIGFLAFSNTYWYQIVVSAVFFFNAILFIILGLSCMGNESEKSESSSAPVEGVAQNKI